MTRCGLLLCVTLVYIISFKPQEGLAFETLNHLMISQNEANPVILYNHISKKIFLKARQRLRIGSYTGGWITKVSFNMSVNGNMSSNANKTDPSNELDARLQRQNENVLRIKVAQLFRGNIIKAFGYILHRPNMELNSELYTSLYFIYTSLKLNHVNMLGLVSILNGLAFKTSNERFLDIFNAMETQLPEYLRCSATVWKHAIETKEVNMDVIFKPTQNSALVVDILAGMNQELLERVTSNQTAEPPKNDKEREIFYNMNINILQMMRHAHGDRKSIQPTFLGALIPFFPRTYIQPSLEESISLVTQYFDQIEIVNWDDYVAKLTDTQTENPYDLVMEIFSMLRKDPTIPNPVKDSMSIIEENLFRRNPTAINPYYSSIASLVVYDKIDLHTMLRYITREAFPLETVVAAARVRYYLDKNSIRHLNLMQGFNPYDYESPTEIFLSLLVRVIKRQPDLPLEILDSTGNVYSNLLVSYRHVQSPAVVPDDVSVPTLVLGLQSPEKDAVLWNKTANIADQLVQNQLEYEDILAKVPEYKCSTPLLCYVKLLEEILRVGSGKTAIKDKKVAEDVIKHIYVTGNHNVTVKSTPLFLSTLGEKALSPIIICDEDKTTTIHVTPTEGKPVTPTTAKPTPVTTPTTPTTVVDNITVQPWMISTVDQKVLITIVKNISQKTPEEQKNVELMLKMLESDEFKMRLNKSEHLPAINGFIMVLDYYQNHNKTIKGAKEITASFRKFMQKFISNLKKVRSVLQQISIELQPTHPILIRLIIAVPAPKGDEKEKFEALKQILSNEKLFQGIYKDLKKDDYKNAGTLLEAVLRLSGKLKKGLTENQRKVVQYYIGKVQKQGLGQSKVEWGLNVNVVNMNVDIAGNMDKAINFKRLDNKGKHEFNKVVRYLKTNKKCFNSWSKWVYYTQAGEFTHGLFKHIARQRSVTREVKTAVEHLSGYIRYNGTGADPAY